MDPKPCMLVVDDDDALTGLFCDLFKDRFDVEARGDARAALEGLAERSPDVILLDFNMPGMNGIDALRAIRRIRPDIPVIMVSGATEVRLAEEAFEIGAFAYLPKPFQVHYAEHLVATALVQRHPR